MKQIINFERLGVPYVDYRSAQGVTYERITPKLVEVVVRVGVENLVGQYFRVIAVGKDDVILDVKTPEIGWSDSNIGDSYYLYAPYFAIEE